MGLGELGKGPSSRGNGGQRQGGVNVCDLFAERLGLRWGWRWGLSGAEEGGEAGKCSRALLAWGCPRQLQSLGLGRQHGKCCFISSRTFSSNKAFMQAPSRKQV